MGLRKQFINNFVFPTWACAAGFNTNNKNVEYSKAIRCSSHPMSSNSVVNSGNKSQILNLQLSTSHLKN